MRRCSVSVIQELNMSKGRFNGMFLGGIEKVLEFFTPNQSYISHFIYTIIGFYLLTNAIKKENESVCNDLMIQTGL